MDDSLKEKYQFIEFLLLFKGQLTRNELVVRFSIGEATASRLIASYLETYPDQMVFLGSRLGYFISDNFQLFYSHSVEEGLQYFAYGKICNYYPVERYGADHFFMQQTLDLILVAQMTRSIVNKRQVEINYVSTSSGANSKKLIPHSIFKMGDFWYFRAFEIMNRDVKINYKDCYKTFKFNRILNIVDIIPVTGFDGGKTHDDEWNSYRRILVVPHPKASHPESQMLDLGMGNLEAKEILISEALLGFTLIDLRVDCSQNAQLNAYEYPLYLKNRSELLSVPSMKMAPGF